MTNVSTLTEFFAKPQRGYESTLSASVASGAATIPVTSASAYANGDNVVWILKPGTADQVAIFGEISGNSIINAKWTDGTAAASYPGGTTVVDYQNATAIAAMTRGIKVQHNDDGTHGAITASSLTATGNGSFGGTLAVTGNTTLSGTANVVGTLSENSVAVSTIRASLVPYDFVSSGGVITISSGLTGAMSNIVAFIGGARITASSIANKAYTASKDTYVDFGSDGTVDYNEVANGAASPALSANHIRLGVVVTNGTDITSIRQYAWDTLGNKVYRTFNNFNRMAGVTLAAAADTLTIATIPYRAQFRMIFRTVPTGGDVEAFVRFNADTGNNYARRVSFNGGAEGTGTSTSAIGSAQASTGPFHSEWFCGLHETAVEKIFYGHETYRSTAGAGNAPSRAEMASKWANTTAVISSATAVNISGSGDYSAGTTFEVLEA